MLRGAVKKNVRQGGGGLVRSENVCFCGGGKNTWNFKENNICKHEERKNFCSLCPLRPGGGATGFDGHVR